MYKEQIKKPRLTAVLILILLDLNHFLGQPRCSGSRIVLDGIMDIGTVWKDISIPIWMIMPWGFRSVICFATAHRLLMCQAAVNVVQCPCLTRMYSLFIITYMSWSSS
jgi:hypothetical protein